MSGFVGFVWFLIALWVAYRFMRWNDSRSGVRCSHCIECRHNHDGTCCHCGRAL